MAQVAAAVGVFVGSTAHGGTMANHHRNCIARTECGQGARRYSMFLRRSEPVQIRDSQQPVRRQEPLATRYMAVSEQMAI